MDGSHSEGASIVATERLLRAWVADVPGNGMADLISVFRNPSRKEFNSILRSSSGVLRGWLGREDLMVFDADATHAKIAKGLEGCGLGSQILRGGILQSGAFIPLNLHLDREGPFLEMDNWMSRAAEEGDVHPFETASDLMSKHLILGRLYHLPALVMRESY